MSSALRYARDSRGTAITISADDAFKYTSFYQPYLADVNERQNGEQGDPDQTETECLTEEQK